MAKPRAGRVNAAAAMAPSCAGGTGHEASSRPRLTRRRVARRLIRHLLCYVASYYAAS
jgi:hypothetical protein